MTAARFSGHQTGEIGLDQVFVGALIFLVLVAAFLLARKAVDHLRKTPPAGATPKSDPATTLDDVGIPRSEIAAGAPLAGGEFVGMNRREEEEFMLVYGTRKQRKAIRDRRRAAANSRTEPRP